MGALKTIVMRKGFIRVSLYFHVNIDVVNTVKNTKTMYVRRCIFLLIIREDLLYKHYLQQSGIILNIIELRNYGLALSF